MDVDTNQPLGTPTWIDLGVPDLDRALAFYGAVFGWDFDVGPEEYGRYTTCLLRGRRVAALSAEHDPAVGYFWNVYLATPDCDRHGRAGAGGRRHAPDRADRRDGPGPAGDRPRSGRRAVRAVAGPRAHRLRRWSTSPGRSCATTWSPPTRSPRGSSTRRSSTSRSTATRTCPASTSPSCAVPTGTRSAASWACPAAPSAWATTFEVAGTDEAVRRALDARRHAPTAPTDFLYGRIATDHRPVRRGVLDHHPAELP